MTPPLRKWLAKYNVPGPRYTSYPTVPAWVTTVGPDDFKDSLQSLGANEPLSLYFHLPFCERLCHFCGCMQVITSDHSRSAPYVKHLLNEIDQVSRLLPKQRGKVTQLHFGGGTPNFLQPQEIDLLIEKIRDCFTLATGAEIAIEMHPRTSTHAFCDAIWRQHFNRISLGVQDFDPKVQQLIHRHQSYEMTAEMLSYLRKLGFKHFNFDLIYGLPGQNDTSWKDTLEKVVHLKPNRLAVYSYAHVPWVRPVQRSFKDGDLPSPETKIHLFEMAYETLQGHGYCPIGMDHFALADDELSLAQSNGSIHRNFMGYSTRADAHQIGFGVSAISYVGGNYFQNQKELPNYENAIQSNQLSTFRGYLLNTDDRLRRDLITQIMCNREIDIPTFEHHWNIKFADYFQDSLQQLSSLQDDGLLEWNGTTLKSRGLGHLFLRNIAMAFDNYLIEIKRSASTPTFSKTV